MKLFLLLAAVFFAAPPRQPPLRYPSLNHFLDSVFRPTGVRIIPVNVSAGRGKSDTVHFRHSTRITKSMGIVKSIAVLNKHLDRYDWYYRSNFLGIGNKIFKDTIVGRFHFNYMPGGIISYKKNTFVAMQGQPFDCNGSSCRLNKYPVIGMSKKDTLLLLLNHPEDVSPLRYADLDKDGYLDFIDMQVTLEADEIRRLVNEYKRFGEKEFYGLDIYKITLLTFKQGKWQRMKDRNGKEYYMIIELEESLRPDRPFKLLMANWFDWQI